MGHGHVTPNADGSRARCGGPAICGVCQREAGRLERPKAEAQTADSAKAQGQAAPLSEGCCFNDYRDQCTALAGAKCVCGCHANDAVIRTMVTMRREAWEATTREVAQLRATLALAVDALSEVRDDYDHMIEGGPALAPEDAAVTALCEQWGYGAVISRAAYLWQQKDASGAYTKGPCAGTVRSNLTLVRKALKRARGALRNDTPDAAEREAAEAREARLRRDLLELRRDAREQERRRRSGE